MKQAKSKLRKRKKPWLRPPTKRLRTRTRRTGDILAPHPNRHRGPNGVHIAAATAEVAVIVVGIHPHRVPVLPTVVHRLIVLDRPPADRIEHGDDHVSERSRL